MAAKGLIKHGMAWRIGDGTTTMIRKDRWIDVESSTGARSELPED